METEVAVAATVRALHQIFAAVWVGATVYVTVAVLPALRDGEGSSEMVGRLTSRFTAISIVSVVVLLVTGGHLAGTLYTFESLIETTSGNLVLVMTALWLVLAGVLHVATSKLDGEGAVEKTADDAYAWYVVGSLLGVALLVNGVLFAYF